MNEKLLPYKFPEEAMHQVEPLVELAERGDQEKFERKFGTLALTWINQIEKNQLSAAQVDQFFTLLDLYLGDHCRFSLTQKAEDLIFEGMILHDLGKPFGADIALMKQLAKVVSKRK